MSEPPIYYDIRIVPAPQAASRSSTGKLEIYDYNKKRDQKGEEDEVSQSDIQDCPV
jgi:hypothetical protein